MNLRVFLLPLFLLGHGCSGDEEPPGSAGTCSKSNDCPPGKTCDSASGQCIPLPEGGLLGTFSCTVVDAASPEQPIGSVDVLGKVSGVEYQLTAAVACSVASVGKDRVLSIQMFQFTPGQETGPGLYVTLDLLGGANTSSFDLLPAKNAGTFRSATLRLVTGADTLNSKIVGWASGGRVVLAGSTQLGGTLQGRLSVDLLPGPPERAKLLSPCPRGAVDCGSTFRDLCTTSIPEKKGQPLCSVLCESLADCPAGALECSSNGLCF